MKIFFRVNVTVFWIRNVKLNNVIFCALAVKYSFIFVDFDL